MTTSARRGLLTLLYLWVGLGVSLALYRPVAATKLMPTAHHAGHMASPAPEKPTEPNPRIITVHAACCASSEPGYCLHSCECLKSCIWNGPSYRCYCRTRVYVPFACSRAVRYL